MWRDTKADEHLNLLYELENYLGKTLAPYEEFVLGGKTYYLSPGGLVYRKYTWSEEEGGYFCGYLDDDFWHYLRDYLKKGGASQISILANCRSGLPTCQEKRLGK